MRTEFGPEWVCLRVFFLWDKCLSCEETSKCVLKSLCVCILLCGSGCMWTNQAHFSSHAFRKVCTRGLWYPPLPTPAQQCCSAFVANPCFLNWLHPQGKENTFYRQAGETLWQNRLQTASIGTEVLITSVSLFIFYPISFFIASPSGTIL